MKDIKNVIKILLVLYVSFVIAYFFNHYTHKYFLCEYHKTFEFWSCSGLHIITCVMLFIILFLEFLTLLFKQIN